MAKSIEIGWSDLNEQGKLKVAEAYGYDTPAQFEEHENYDLYPCFIQELEDDCEDAGDEECDCGGLCEGDGCERG